MRPKWPMPPIGCSRSILIMCVPWRCWPLPNAARRNGQTHISNGLFSTDCAADLASPAHGQTQITNYGKSVYTKYHGSEQGWSDLLTTAKTTPLPPAGFTISQYVPPTPAEQAAELVKTKQPKEMSFAQWELVLSAGKPEDAEKVW